MRKAAFLMMVVLVLLPALATAALGEQPALTDEPTLSLELGYDGTIAYMREMPIAVTLAGGSRDIEGVVSLDVYRSQTHYDRYEYPVSVAARATQRFFMPVRLMMRQPEFHARLESDGEVLAEATAKPMRELGHSAVLVGVLSPDPLSLFYLNMNPQTDMDMASELWSMIALDARSFPDTVDQMNAFNVLAVDGFDPRTLTERQQAALRLWIEQGGIAIVGGGANASVSYPFFEDITGLSAGGLVEATDVPRALMTHWMGLDAPSMAAIVAEQGGAVTLPGGEPMEKLPSPALMINQPVGEAVPTVSGQHPVLYQVLEGRGAVITATFELGAKPLAQWEQMHRIWPNYINRERALSEIYRDRIEQQRDYGYYSGNEDNLSYMATALRVPSGKSAAPALVLLGGYLLLAGALSYLVLKRLDKREFMWLTVPALAVVFALSVRALGARLQFDQPLGATVTSVSYDGQGEPTVKSAGALTANAMKPVEIRASLARTIEPSGMRDDYYNSYDYDPAKAQKAPDKLRYRYLLGDEPGVVMPNKAAWSVFSFNMPDPEIDVGRISGRAWMEDDGLHAEIKNESGQALSAGALIGNIGFNRMSGLADGQTGFAFLKQAAGADQGMLAVPQQAGGPMTTVSPMPAGVSSIADEDDWGEEGDEPDPEETEAAVEDERAGDEDEDGEQSAEEGEDEIIDSEAMTSSSSGSATASSSGYGYSSAGASTALPVDGEMRAVRSMDSYLDYDYLNAIAHPDARYDPQHGLTWDSDDPEQAFIGEVYHRLNNEWNRWSGYGRVNEAPVALHYIALMEQLPAPMLQVDGQQVEQVRNRAFVDVAVAYEPIGPTGVVCYLPGMLAPKRVMGELPADPTTVKEEDLEPTAPGASYGSNQPMDFVFTLTDGRDIAVDSLELTALADEGVPTMALYNVQTKAWDERKLLYERLRGAEADPYLFQGRIFVRMIPDTQSVSLRGYSGSVYAPSMALKGRLK